MLTESRWIKNESDALMPDDAYVCVTFRLKCLPDLPSDAPVSVDFAVGDVEYQATFAERHEAVMRRIARSAADYAVANARAVHAAAGVSDQQAEARAYHGHMTEDGQWVWHNHPEAPGAEAPVCRAGVRQDT